MDPALQSVLNLSSVLSRIDSVQSKDARVAAALNSSSVAVGGPIATPSTADVSLAEKTETDAPLTATEDDNKKEESEENDKEKETEKNNENDKAAASSSYSTGKWFEFKDPTSGKSYFHNYETQETTWDAPETFTPYIPQPLAAPLTQTTQTYTHTYTQYTQAYPQYEDYRTKAYFSNTNGRYTGSQSYWEKTGRPEDKAGRQLSTFIDLQDLERNRAETNAKRAEFQRAMQGANWKEIKAEQKEKKKRKRDKWLLED